MESIHDLRYLLPDIFGSFHGSSLNEIVKAPSVLASVHFPLFVNSEQSEVVSIFMIEFCLLLISNLLLFSRSIKDILN